MFRLLRLTFLIPLLAACIGKATPPQQIKMTQAQNEVIGKFAREIGERELNIMLRDPYDATLPGIPVGDLLYILTQVNEDRLIQLVQGVGATTVLELLIAMKRVGCTRANTVPIASGYGFDARSIPSLNNCKWQQLHLPNIMVQLLNGASANGMTTLIDTLKHSYTNLGLAANKPLQVTLGGAGALVGNATYDATVQHYSYLMKLAYVVVGFDTPTSADPNLSSPSLVGPPKLFNLMNLAIDGRDMVFLIDMLDKANCPGVASTTSNCTYVDTTNNLTTYDASGNLWTDIAAGNQMQETQNLLSIMSQVTNTNKMATLINGYRSTRYNLSQDEAQVRYFVDRLRVVLEHVGPVTACPAGGPYPFPTTTTYAAGEQDRECNFQNFTVPQGGNAEWNLKLATIINLVTNINRMMDFVYQIDDGFDSATHIVTTTFPNRGIDNLMVMVNNINPNAAHPGPNTTNNELTTAAYLIDNVPLDPSNTLVAKRNRISYLAQYIGTTYNVLQLSCYTGVADSATVGNACYKKGLINQVASGSKVNDSGAADLTAAGQKLTNMMGQVTEIEDMRFIIRKVDMTQLNQLVAGLLISGTTNTANLINQISGNDCWATPTDAAGAALPLAGVISYNVTPGVGAPYTGLTTVTFTGGATAATGRPLLDSSNRVAGIVILTEGDGYPYNPILPVPGWPVITIADAGGGTGSTATAVTGRCVYNAPADYRGFPSATSSGALGLGKMVNIINYLNGSITNLVTLINNITDGQKLGILINGISRSSNLVGVTNSVVDTTRNNNATINDMIGLLNSISRVDTYKLVHMLDALSDATETATTTIPATDHDNVAQLMAPYCRTDLAGLSSTTCPATLGNYVHQTSGVGSTAMANLVSSLTLTGGGGFPVGSTAFTFGVGATANYNVSTDGSITSVRILSPGSGCTSVPTVSFVGPSNGAVLVPYLNATGGVSQINIINSGSGFTVNPIPLTVTGPGCAGISAEAYYAGIGSVQVTNGGTAGTYTTSQSLIIAGGLYAANATATVSGQIAAGGLSNIAGGTGYVNGQICPIVGAGGSGGTCTAVVAGGVLTGCTIAAPTGSNYAAGRIVKIGGTATAVATVVAGAITGYTITNSGCGYLGAPPITVQAVGCTTNPAAGTANVLAGRITGVAGGLGGTGCTVGGVKVIIGESGSYAYHADGASAIVGSVAGGVVTSISVSDASINTAQLVQLIDRDATGTGIALNYRPDDAAWTSWPAWAAGPILVTSACSGTGLVPTVGVPCASTDTLRPNISAREALVRLLHHGVSPTITSSKSYFNGVLGAGAGPANGVPGTYAMDWPGLGPQYLAGAILNNVSSQSTQTLLTMVNSDTISLEDTVILLGCADRSSYSNGWTTFSWFQLCSELGAGSW